jgi:hypothetical protein
MSKSKWRLHIKCCGVIKVVLVLTKLSGTFDVEPMKANLSDSRMVLISLTLITKSSPRFVA